MESRQSRLDDGLDLLGRLPQLRGDLIRRQLVAEPECQNVALFGPDRGGDARAMVRLNQARDAITPPDQRRAARTASA